MSRSRQLGPVTLRGRWTRGQPVQRLVPTVPSVSASVGRRAMAARSTNDNGEQFDTAITGPMIGLGAGVEHFFSPVDGPRRRSIGFRYRETQPLQGRRGRVGPKANPTTSIRMRLGVNWRRPALVTARHAFSLNKRHIRITRHSMHTTTAGSLSRHAQHITRLAAAVLLCTTLASATACGGGGD